MIALLAIHSSTFAQTERTIYDVQTLKLDESTVDNVISFEDTDEKSDNEEN